MSKVLFPFLVATVFAVMFGQAMFNFSAANILDAAKMTGAQIQAKSK